MADRFRLIYLKSTGTDKPSLDEPAPFRGEKISKPVSPLFQNGPLKTLSSDVVLKQVRIDLKHPSPKIRMMAVQYLKHGHPSVAIPLLQEVLSDHDSDVRAEGLSSLANFEDPIVTALLRKYLKDHDPKVRLVALRGTFKRGGQIDLNLLMQFLSDESPLVRRKVATLLGWTPMEGVLPALVELSKDEDPQVRKAALASLLSLYPEESEERMIEAMTDRDSDLRKWAKQAMEKIVASPLRNSTRTEHREARRA